MVSGEWVLGVQIQHFESVYGSEIINGRFCCCDDGSENDNNVSECKENINELSGCDDSNNPCDTYFLVYVRDCLYNNTCNYTQYYRLKDDTSLIQLILPIPLEIDLSENVRNELLCSEIKL